MNILLLWVINVANQDMCATMFWRLKHFLTVSCSRKVYHTWLLVLPFGEGERKAATFVGETESNLVDHDALCDIMKLETGSKQCDRDNTMATIVVNSKRKNVSPTTALTMKRRKDRNVM